MHNSKKSIIFLCFSAVFFLFSSLTITQAQSSNKIRALIPLGHTDGVTVLRYSSDGRLLASASRDQTIKLWLPDREILLRTLRGHTKSVNSIDFSPDGKLLASGSNDETVKIWDVDERKMKFSLPARQQTVYAVCFSPDGKLLASGGADGTVKIWNPQTGELLKEFSAQWTETLSLSFSPDGRFLAGGSRKTLKIWEIATWKVQSIPSSSPKISTISYSPDGKFIASNGPDKQVDVTNAATGAKVYSLGGFGDQVSSVEFSPDGKFLATGSFDKTVKIWDAANGKLLRSFAANLNAVGTAQFSPNGTAVAVGDEEGQIFTLDAKSGQLIKMVSGQTFSLGTLAISNDNRLLAVAGADKSIHLWNLQMGKVVMILKGHTGSITSLAFDAAGTTLASGSWDGTAKIWNTETGAEIRTIQAHSADVESVCFSPDDKRLASSGSDNRIKIWEAASGKNLLDVENKSTLPYHTVVFSPDGKQIVGGHFYESAAYDAVRGKLLYTSQKAGAAVSKDYILRGRNIEFKPKGVRGVNALFSTINGNAAAFSANGGFLAARDSTRLVLMDAASGAKIRDLAGDFWQIKNFVFTRDGRYLIGGDEITGQMRVWNTANGEELPELKGSSIGGIAALKLSFDGNLLIGASREGEIRIWDLRARKELISLLSNGDVDWLAAAPNGFFEASPAAQKRLGFQVGTEVIGAEQLKSRLSLPGLTAKSVAGQTLPAIAEIPIYPGVKTKIVTVGGKQKLEIELTNRGGGIGKTQVLFGGREYVADARPAGFDPRTNRALFTVDLPIADKKTGAMPDKISVVVFNSDGDLSNKTAEIIR